MYDTQFVGEDRPARMPFGHPTPAYATRLARGSNAQRVRLFHHDPARIDDELDELAAAGAETPGPDVLLARQGMTLDVGAH